MPTVEITATERRVVHRALTDAANLIATSAEEHRERLILKNVADKIWEAT